MRSLTVEITITFHVWNRLKEFGAFAPIHIFRSDYSGWEEPRVFLFSSMIIKHSTCHCCMDRFLKRCWIFSVNFTFCLTWHHRLFYLTVILLIAILGSYLTRKICIFWRLMSKLIFWFWGWYLCKPVNLASRAWILHDNRARRVCKWICEFWIDIILCYHRWVIIVMNSIGWSRWCLIIKHLLSLFRSSLSNRRLVELLFSW